MPWSGTFGPWGSTPWGGAIEPPLAGFYVVSALATGSNTFRVWFSEPPRFTTPIAADSAANMTNFVLTRTDTGGVIQLLGASQVADDALALDFVRLGVWESHLITYHIQAGDTLVSTVAAHALIDPKYAEFLGLPASVQPLEETQELADLRNPQTDETRINGGLVVSTAGEYQLEAGVSLVKKLIIRRIVTERDSFVHLQGYGESVSPARFWTTVDLMLFQTSLERGVRKEPEVESARVAITLAASGVLTVGVRARLRNSPQTLQFDVPLGGV